MAAFTYIVQCADGTFYTGWTNDLVSRMAVHNTGKGAKYTRGRTPVILVYYEEYPNSKKAQVREYQIKKMNRQQKAMLIAAFSGDGKA